MTEREQEVMGMANDKGLIGYAGKLGGPDWPIMRSLMKQGYICFVHSYNTRPWEHLQVFERRLYEITQCGRDALEALRRKS